MKKAKLALGAIALFAVLGISTAVQAHKFNHIIYTTDVSGDLGSQTTATVDLAAPVATVYVTFDPTSPATLFTAIKNDE